jgi:hypothetical protein
MKIYFLHQTKSDDEYSLERALDKKKLCGCFILQLTNAFDCVNHNVLLEKINFYGILGSAIKLMT